jgi:hypothetical protein
MWDSRGYDYKQVRRDQREYLNERARERWWRGGGVVSCPGCLSVVQAGCAIDDSVPAGTLQILGR